MPFRSTISHPSRNHSEMKSISKEAFKRENTSNYVNYQKIHSTLRSEFRAIRPNNHVAVPIVALLNSPEE